MEISNFGRNLKAAREYKKLTQYELADELQTTQTTVSSWESRGVMPRQSMRNAICKQLNVTEQDLMGYEDGFFAKLHGISPKPMAAAAETAYLPLLGRVHAGDAQEPDIVDSSIPVPKEVADRHPNAYFLEVEGDCMSRVYPEGCYILIDEDKQPQNGSIAVVSIDGCDYVMRRMYRGASVLVLSPDSYSDGYDDIVITQEGMHTVELVGTVVWYQPPEELE